MTYVTTLDVAALTAEEYRAVMEESSVEKRPERGFSWRTGIRKEGFERFLQTRLAPGNEAFGINRQPLLTLPFAQFQ
jgi:hypothetical protein